MDGFEIRAVSAFHPDAVVMRKALSKTLEHIVGNAGRHSFATWDDTAEDHFFFVAYVQSTPIGCAGLRRIFTDSGEIKRMYAAPAHPGVGRHLLAYVEAIAVSQNNRALYLETRAVNSSAIQFYIKHGFERVAPYGSYAERADAACFKKAIG